MGVTFTKPRNLKYTDMAIYIDKHLPDIKVPNENPEVEEKIYEYLYHILFALSCKSGYFKNFADYDLFACYGACELFFSMRKKLINEGKQVRGKTVVPIKSSLNFIKATMFPLKINYQREMFMEVVDPAIHENAENLDAQNRESIQAAYRGALIEDLRDTTKIIPSLIEKILDRTPFRYDALMRKRLKLSIMLTLLDDITLPNKLKNKIKSKETEDNRNKIVDKLTLAYELNPNNVILWHLEPRYNTYVRVLTQRLKRWIATEFQIAIHEGDLSDNIIDSIINSAFESKINYKENEIL